MREERYWLVLAWANSERAPWLKRPRKGRFLGGRQPQEKADTHRRWP